ncbi:hypothetical protein WJX74_000111 [Apatococcus lobatus]|uniref:Dynein regulatory complex protein 10 n=1 Tax=Apatococcus lobatus TaxID=904363 RepID=A0AAW1QZE8_9CHLO
MAAQELVNVVSDAGAGFRLLSWSSNLLQDQARAAGNTSDALEGDTQLQELLFEHQQLAQTSGSYSDDQLFISSVDLWKALQACDSLKRQASSIQASGMVEQLACVMDEMAASISKRLSAGTSASSKERLAELHAREMRAVKDRAEMEGQLAADRIERAHQMEAIKAAQARSQAELAALEADAAQAKASLGDQAESLRESARLAFLDAERAAEAEISRLEKALSSSLSQARDSEAGLRKKRTKALAELQMWQQRHTEEVGEKEREAQEESGLMAQAMQACQMAERGHAALLAERQAFEEAAAEAVQAKQRAVLAVFRSGRAATKIQRAWKSYLLRKAAADNPKASKKAADKDGKGKGGDKGKAGDAKAKPKGKK